VTADPPQAATGIGSGLLPPILKVFALGRVEERRVHLLEGGVRLVGLFDGDLHLGISDLLQLGAAGRCREKSCRGKKTA
jgi:hypothetical protein